MDVREAIADLLDHYSDKLGKLTHRGFATEANVNVGQFSNWLRINGPFGVEKQGAVAQVMLIHIELALPSIHDAQIKTIMEERAEILRFSEPLQSLLAASPQRVLAGEAISPTNHYYIKRHADEQLDARIESKLIQLAILGGPKTGRSSLLFAARQKLAPSRNTLFVDFARYKPRNDLGTFEIEKNFCAWFAGLCEAQAPGRFVTVLTGRKDGMSWILKNILPNSRDHGCVLLMDHLEALPFQEDNGKKASEPREFEILNGMVNDWLANRKHGLLDRFGIVAATDPMWRGLSGAGGDTPPQGLMRLDKLYLDEMGAWAAQELLKMRGKDQVEVKYDKTLQRSGGHPYLMQLAAKEYEDPVRQQEAVLSGFVQIADTICNSWAPGKGNDGSLLENLCMNAEALDSGVLDRFRQIIDEKLGAKGRPRYWASLSQE